MKKSGKKVIQEDFDLMDINDFVTDGKEGLICYPMNNDNFSNLGFAKGDLLIVDPTHEYAPEALTLYLEKGKYLVKKGETGLRLVARNGKQVAPVFGSPSLGVITYVIHNVMKPGGSQ